MIATNFSRRRFLALGLAAGAGIASIKLTTSTALAQSAEELRSSGQAGERFDGFMEARDPAVASAVTRINNQRKAVYEARAKQQGVTLEQVGKIYAEQIYKKLPSGSWFKLASGQWAQK
tara:strand:+ start:1603 stop:1959 length:357 start_codon:yes stop_codon:yes gene_type:complete